jgi:ABC-type multidrug transport system permease subunit
MTPDGTSTLTPPAARAPAPPARTRRTWKDTALVQLSLARFREFMREPEAVFWTFIFPVLLASGLGLAFRSQPQEIVKIGIIAGSQAESLRTAFTTAGGIEPRVLDDTAAARVLRIGEIALVVEPQANGGVTYRYDPTREDSRVARLIVDQALQRGAGRTDAVAVQESLVSERGSRYIDFVIPGLLAMNLMGSGIWGIGFSIVDARRKKLLKRLVATPMRRSHYLLSFLLFRLALMVIEVSFISTFAVLVFGVPMRGPLVVFFTACLLGTFTFGSMGLLIASRARTVEGASGLMNLAMVPMWVGSGVFFSATNFPDAVQPFVQALPLTAVVDMVRGNMLQGSGFAALSGEFAIAIVWSAVCFTLALRLFRWR